MCGRFVQTCSVEELSDLLEGMEMDLSALDPDYNVGPGKSIVTVMQDQSSLRCARTTWGMPLKGTSALNINARSETVAQKSLFKDLLSTGRCVIPAAGFYEWQQQGRNKQPWYFTRCRQQPMYFAGLWSERSEGAYSTILTTSANELVGRIHDRMPVVLRPEDVSPWLLTDRPEQHLSLLAAFPKEQMESWPVSSRVNNVVHAGSENILPVDIKVIQQLSLF